MVVCLYMELNTIDEDWYSHDDTSLFKKIMEQQEKQMELLLFMNQSLDKMAGRLSSMEIETNRSMEHISLRISKVEEKLKELDITKIKKSLEELSLLKDSDMTKIKKSLEELSILKEREINALLREHIPFPFVMKQNSPLANFPFRRPFSKPK